MNMGLIVANIVKCGLLNGWCKGTLRKNNVINTGSSMYVHTIEEKPHSPDW